MPKPAVCLPMALRLFTTNVVSQHLYTHVMYGSPHGSANGGWTGQANQKLGMMALPCVCRWCLP